MNEDNKNEDSQAGPDVRIIHMGLDSVEIDWQSLPSGSYIVEINNKYYRFVKE